MRKRNGIEIVNVAEAAEILGRCGKTIRRDLAAGELERCRVPGDRRVFVTRASVDGLRDAGLSATVVRLTEHLCRLEHEIGRLRRAQRALKNAQELDRIVVGQQLWATKNLGVQQPEGEEAEERRAARMAALRRWHPDIFDDERPAQEISRPPRGPTSRRRPHGDDIQPWVAVARRFRELPLEERLALLPAPRRTDVGGSRS